MNREREFHIRLTEKEHTEIKANAYECGLTVSEYIRMAIRRHPLIPRPTQNAVEHFQSMQQFQMILTDALDYLPHDKSGKISQSFEGLLHQAKRLI